MEYEIWCRCLRQYRQSQELTQETVAFGIGVSRSHYSAIEHGRTVVNYRQLYNLAKFFQMRVGDVMTFPMLKQRGKLSRLPKAPTKNKKKKRPSQKR